MFVGMDGPGFPWQQKLTKVVGYGTALYPGDVVSRVADGSIEVITTPGTTLISGINSRWGAASTATNHEVLVSSNALFEGQDNNATDGIAAADLGANANCEANAGSATKLTSGHEINETGITTTATLDFHLIELLDTPNNAHGAWARIVVKINAHRYGFATAGV